jgi:hypothetical protein
VTLTFRTRSRNGPTWSDAARGTTLISTSGIEASSLRAGR